MNKTISIALMAFFCILVFLISIFGATALKEDFSAATDATIFSYQCSQTTVPVKITNTGSVGSSYELVLSGDAVNWAGMSVSNLILYPGDTKIVYLYLGIPCDTKEKTYSLGLSIKTLLGLEKDMELVVNVEKPQNLKIVPVATSASLDPCTPVNYHIQLDNRGSFIEEYKLDILSKDFLNRVTISENPVFVQPNTARDVYFYVTPFACNEYGKHSIKASVFAKNSELYEEFYMDMIVNPTGVPVIAEGVGRIKTTHTAFEYDIPIRNLGQTTAVYEVFLEGPAWVSIAPTSFSLAPEGSGVLTLMTSPNENTPEGTYTVTLVAKVANTGVEYAKDITIKLKEPTFLDNIISQYLWAIILGAIVLVVLIVVFVFYLRYLERTKEIRAELRLQKQKEKEVKRKEKEALKKEKEKLKEAKRKEKEELKKELKKERERRKAERLAAIKERKKLREQKKKERKKLKAQKKADKIKLKKQKIAERERLKKERENERLRKAAEIEKGRLLRKAQFESKKEEARHSVIKRIALKHLKAEYIMHPKDKGAKKSPWLSWIVGLIIFIVIAAGLIYSFLEYIKQFFTEFWMYVVLGVVAVIILLGIIRVITSPSVKIATKRELNEAKKELKKILEASFSMISRKELRRKKEEYKKKLKQARKKASKAASKSMSKFAKWWVPAVIIIAVIVGVIYFLFDWIIANIMYIIAVIAGIVILIVLLTLVSRIGRRKKRWAVLKANKTASMPVKWSKGLYEVFIKTKREIKDVTVVAKRYSRKKTFYAPNDKVYQFFEIKRKNIGNSDIDKVSFRFRVGKSWFKKMKEGSIRLMRYSGGRWTGCSTEVVSEDKRYVYFQASSAGFSHFAIVGKPLPKPKKEKRDRKKEREEKRAAKKAAKAARRAEKNKIKAMESKIVQQQRKAEKKLKKKDTRKAKKARKKSPFAFAWIGYLILALLIIGGICIAAYFAISYIADERTDSGLPSPIEDEVSNVDIDFEEGTDITDLEEAINGTEGGIIPAGGLEEADIIDDIDDVDSDIEDIEEDLDEAEGGIPKQTWDEDTEQILDLNSYFHDPDNDMLIFSYSAVDHIDIEVEEGIVTFTPDTNWFGEEEVVFTADDGKGQSVESNPVKLVVKNVPESSIFAQTKAYGGPYLKYIIAAIVVLILAILMFEYRKPILKFLEEE